ncbi:MAG: CYTH domain-containing protein [Muribaculaceae bacterium]|nr:CYTH domain-containing protein [Muribaculaceae bacterium]
MAFEIEHKYLVTNDSYKKLATAKFHIFQGYLCRVPERTVRVRIKEDKAYITVKGKNEGAKRLEFEYEIPKEEAMTMLEICQSPILEKVRYNVPFDGKLWEVDEFLGSKNGLTLAEIELMSEGESYAKPDFIGENVTGNPKYYNSNL